MEYTKSDFEQHYKKLDEKLDALRMATIVLHNGGYAYTQIIDGLREVMEEINKEMLRVKIRIMIFDIQDNSTEKMKEYIEVLEEAIDSI